MNTQNLKTAKLIKDILVKLAVDDKLPMDMNGLDESIFLTAFPVDKNKPVKSYIVCWVLREIEEGVGGKGDITTDTDHYTIIHRWHKQRKRRSSERTV